MLVRYSCIRCRITQSREEPLANRCLRCRPIGLVLHVGKKVCDKCELFQGGACTFDDSVCAEKVWTRKQKCPLDKHEKPVRIPPPYVAPKKPEPQRLRSQYRAIATRNLIYHVFPAGDWESIAGEISQHVAIFNGKRVIAIADPGGMDIQGVAHRCREMFMTQDVTIYENDKDLRETVTFQPSLDAVLNGSESEASFYAHTKANSTADNVDGATKWRRVMVANLLGRWQEAMKHLESHTFVGTHKMIWPKHQPSPYPTRLIASHPWMHCGTFWWFRHDQVTKLHRPKFIVPDRYAIEAWPSQLIPPEEAYSMWQPWEEHERAWPQRNPYDPGLYEHGHRIKISTEQ